MQNKFSMTDWISSINTDDWFKGKKDKAPTLPRRQGIQTEIKKLKLK